MTRNAHMPPFRDHQPRPSRVRESACPLTARVSVSLDKAAEVDLLQPLMQVRHGRADRLFVLVREQLHALQTPNHAGRLAVNRRASVASSQ